MYSYASQAGIKVSGNILLRDTFPLLCGVDPAVTFRNLHQVQAALNWISDMAAFRSPACTKRFAIFSADIHKTSKQMQKQGRYLHACKSLTLFYIWLGSEV